MRKLHDEGTYRNRQHKCTCDDMAKELVREENNGKQHTIDLAVVHHVVLCQNIAVHYLIQPLVLPQKEIHFVVLQHHQMKLNHPLQDTIAKKTNQILVSTLNYAARTYF